MASTVDVFDLIVVGNGVAAAAALMALADASRSWRIAQIAPSNHAVGPKVGECLSPKILSVFQSMNVSEAFLKSDYLEYGSQYVAWGAAQLLEKSLFAGPYQTGWIVDRSRFDHWLENLATARCRHERIQAAVTEVRYVQGPSCIELTLNSGVLVKSRMVLDASGRTAVIARHFTRRRRLDRLTGAFAFFNQIDASIEPTVGPMVESMPEGWVYSTLLPGRKLAVGLFTDSDLFKSICASSLPLDRHAGVPSEWAQYIRSTDYTARRIETAGFSLAQDALSGWTLADASSQLSEEIDGPGWLSVGDAAFAMDPLSSHGITSALWSAWHGTRAVCAAMHGHREALADYRSRIKTGMAKFQKDRLVIYGAERRFAADPFWSRRH